MLPPPSTDDLGEVRELNRLFIDFLKARARAGDDCLGLERAAIVLMRSAAAESLEALALFPRALFDLDLARLALLRVTDAQALDEPSRQALQLTILHSAWNMSRRSPYAARLFFALDERAIRALRTTTLFELPRLSASGALVSCAFAQCAWIWPKLLTETRPESRRQLMLIALQPQVQVPAPAAHALAHQLFA